MASKAHIELMAQEICSEDWPVHGSQQEASVKPVGCVGSRREGEREAACSPTRNGLTTGSAGVDHRLPVEVGEHLHDRVDEGLLSDMRGPVSVPLSHAAHKKVKVIQIWRPYIPQGLQNFIRFFLLQGSF